MKIKLVLKLFVVANKSVVLKLSLYVLNPPHPPRGVLAYISSAGTCHPSG